MDHETLIPDLYDEDIAKAESGTFTLRFEPWSDKAIEGIPTLEMARRIAHVAHEAMESYANNAMMDY